MCHGDLRALNSKNVLGSYTPYKVPKPRASHTLSSELSDGRNVNLGLKGCSASRPLKTAAQSGKSRPQAYTPQP